MKQGAEPHQDGNSRTGVAYWGSGLVVLVVGGYLAFRALNPIVAAALLIVAATLLGMAGLARDWDRHPRYEEREQLRAERRKASFAQKQGARDKDRAKWEAHQARQRRRAGRQAPQGSAPPE